MILGSANFLNFFFFLSLILPLFLLMTTEDNATNSNNNEQYIYRNVKSYQVLQRSRKTNTALVDLNNGQPLLELGVGGPYQVGNASQVMVGDIWILAGQSNMRGFGFFNNYDKQVPCHVFQSNESWGLVYNNQPVHQIASSPRQVHHMYSDPTVSDPNLVFSRGASLAPFFAEQYQHQLHIPVGLVPCAHGGVDIQKWMKQQQDDDNNTSQTTLYGAMIDKINLVAGGQPKGILWYQGESDAVNWTSAQQYYDHFTLWLQQLQHDLPKDTLFIYAQIGHTAYIASSLDTKNKLDQGWSLVRQAQIDVFQQQEQRKNNTLLTSLVSTIDTELDDFVHLSANASRKIGYRMANAAISLIQRQEVEKDDYESTIIYGNRVTMNHTPYNNGRNWIHTLRIGFYFNGSKRPKWRRTTSLTKVTTNDNEEDDDDELDLIPINGFTLHDTQQPNNPLDGFIYSVRITKDHNVDLYLTEAGYQNMLKHAAQGKQYVVWYGYGQNPQCNLMTTSNIAALAFGPLPVNVTSLPRLSHGGQSNIE
ncbi:SGNH hydrolase-type esterase domain-containing protein [Halteromyces radiatus]|uniref:SGNH hydrolase-type esterase domain-containing protein n=1 Tax=Halteromyces radiatus TaxID=101107 RepID=UPI00221EB2EA|nr:SGNH hydrolase-type esterase domain-containing protein [Halteromyces radiatus]KAI8093277.1 SGNH hydrolase-type esterase domain-containing protein [Halteromyces radiatus]